MSTGWSELGDRFLSEGTWAIGQGPDAPDRQLFRALVSCIDTRTSILEVGFGSCIDLEAADNAGLLDNRDWYGIDATPELVDLARKRFPGHCFDVADICAWQATRPYGVVYARHVLEHVRDGERALAALWETTEGVLILSWFIRPTWTPSEAGCVIGDGFEHHTYSAPRWIQLAARLGAHLYRFDFDHDRTKASVWILARKPEPELAQVAHAFLQSEAFLDAVLPVPERVNEPFEDALDVLVDAHVALGDAIPIVERVDDLRYVVGDALGALTRAEAYMFPRQDEPETCDEIRRVRDAKGRTEAALGAVEDPERLSQVQELRDAHRVIEARLIEAGRL